MTAKTTRTIGAAVFAMAVSAHPMWLTRPIDAQTRAETAWRARTPWGDPDLHGEWTTEGEYGVPFERPDNAGVFEYACHEGNHGMSNILSAARALERTAR